jgi:hypothetical protein
MNKFKLLGIRPRKGCHTNLLKNLSGEQLYPFYDSYKYYNASGDMVHRSEGEIAYYTFETKLPSDLYQVHSGQDNGDIEFNLSAIAGKNGSGKSTLIELFFAAVFVMSQKSGILTPTEIEVKYRITELENQLRNYKKDGEKLIKTKKAFRTAVEKALSNTWPGAVLDDFEKGLLEQDRRENFLAEQLKNDRNDLNQEFVKLREYSKMSERTKVDVLFQVDNQVYVLKVGAENGTLIFPVPTLENFQNHQVKPEKTIGLDNIAELFCYSIAVNYSHYALNSKNMGDWIRFLFHKNDGYQTPLVITPMRTDGNFDINNEMGFAKARLLSNVMLQWFRRSDENVELVDNQFVTEVIFRLNKTKLSKIENYVNLIDGELKGDDERAKAMLKDFFSIALPKYKGFKFRGFALRDKLLNYIVKKIDKMSEYYPGFSPAYEYPASLKNDQNIRLLTKIINDTTHITYKLHQAVHFLEYSIEGEEPMDFHIEPEDLKGNKRVEFSFSLFDLFEWMGNPGEKDLIPYLPPSIFEIDFKVSNSSGHSYRFNGLSSGEQQFVHTIQAVIYHLNNIQSAHANPESVKYQAVNVILDEVELYFHPDFQRGFISKLLRAISRVNPKDEQRIKTVNLLFLTHSPFILSDIPNENVLRLSLLKGKGKTYPYKYNDKDNLGEETFAANINELLSNSFFIEGTAMGQFAEDKVNALIDKVNKKERLTADDQLLIQLIGDKFLRFSIEEFTEKKGVKQ